MASRILRINLTTRTATQANLPPDLTREYIGGRGIGARLLAEAAPAGADPLGPDNKLIFAVGPLAGTAAQSCARWMALTISPLTGRYGRAVGGADFGAWLRRNGYDCIITEGKADAPVFLDIDGPRVAIRPAADLWGKTPWETQEALWQRYGRGARIACIGPAAERLVRYAGIISHRRIAARDGVGTVMGAKRLKAILLHRGERVPVHDQEGFTRAVQRQLKDVPEGGARPRESGCHACSIVCDRVARCEQQPAHQLCDEYGLDAISTSEAVALATNLYEHGILTKADTGGLALTRGDAAATAELIRMIGERRGPGALLAEGAVHAARRIGPAAEQYLRHDMARKKPDTPPVLTALYETGIACAFPVQNGWLKIGLFGQLLASVTGIAEFADEAYLMKAADRIIRLEQRLN
ncbi:MAG TPA: aldehyde ferredoxin oxidoreductase N-terminal domain-containing protein [Symbiobacteriaceae bacterium]|nr:aldehyde ferredoxin oxidoreductase N-terminal domain-containing protein [Symbiobacteriaceae bacterium]